MSQNNTPYGADSGYDRLPAVLTGGGDSYEEGRIRGPSLFEEAAFALKSFEVDKAPITDDVRIHAGEAAGVELGA